MDLDNRENKSEYDFEEAMKIIHNNFKAGAYTTASRDCASFIERAFRDVVRKTIPIMPENDRLRVLEAERKTGKGQKGLESFGFGEIISVIRETKFFDIWSDVSGTNLSAIKMINLNELNKCRINLAHGKGESNKQETQSLINNLNVIIETFGLLSLKSLGQNLPFNQQSGTANISQAGNENLKKAEKQAESHLKPFNTSKGSYYSPTDKSEDERLIIQGGRLKNFDVKAFQEAIKNLKNKENIFALDVGCSSGEVTISRFNSFSIFSHIVGIDKNEDIIERAKERISDDLYSFHAVDIEKPDFEEKIKSILKDHNRESFDFVFSALTIHHLGNPGKVLRKLRKIISKGGVIVLRGSDDGSKVFYPDKDDVIKKTIELSHTVKGISDRKNGRKLYHQLWKAGFRTIKMFHLTSDTAGLSADERRNIFVESMSWRKDPFERYLKLNPDDDDTRENYNWILGALDEMEEVFESEDFYYSEQDTISIGYNN